MRRAALLDGALDAPPWLGQHGPATEWKIRPVASKRLSQWETNARRVLRTGLKLDCKPNGSASDCEAVDAIERLFWERERGYCLELGGLDGVRSSESRRFMQAISCRRVIVDANPIWRDLRRNRSADAVGVTAAICSEGHQTVHFLQHPKDPPVSGIAEFMRAEFLFRWYPAVATLLLSTNASSVAELGPNAGSALVKALAAGGGGGGGRVRVLPVICKTLSQILDAIHLRHVDFAIIDVEGAELSVLRSIDWRRLTFSVLVVESFGKTRPADFATRVAALVRQASNGQYRVLWRKGRNLWFAHQRFVANARPSVGTGGGQQGGSRRDDNRRGQRRGGRLGAKMVKTWQAAPIRRLSEQLHRAVSSIVTGSPPTYHPTCAKMLEAAAQYDTLSAHHAYEELRCPAGFARAHRLGQRPLKHAPKAVGTPCEPWLNRGAVFLLSRLLSRRMHGLEWSMGSSTLYYLLWLGTLHSIEGRAAWATAVTAAVHRRFPRAAWRGDHVNVSDARYVAMPLERASFDFVSIDGDQRPACLSRVRTEGLVAPGGLLLLDNSERASYRTARAPFDADPNWSHVHYSTNFTTQKGFDFETSLYCRNA